MFILQIEYAYTSISIVVKIVTSATSVYVNGRNLADVFLRNETNPDICLPLQALTGETVSVY